MSGYILKAFPPEIVSTAFFGGDVRHWSRVLVSVVIQLLFLVSSLASILHSGFSHTGIHDPCLDVQ